MRDFFGYGCEDGEIYQSGGDIEIAISICDESLDAIESKRSQIESLQSDIDFLQSKYDEYIEIANLPL